ncbi:MAG: endonuclease/exonuclease/phosphatase family protein [Parvibaculaceae bacterium]
MPAAGEQAPLKPRRDPALNTAPDDDPALAAPEDDRIALRRRRRRKRGRNACLFGLLAGLAGLVAGRLGGLWIAFDVFAQFTPQFATIAAACLLGLVMPVARALTAVVLIVAGLIGIGVWPHVQASRHEAALAAPADHRAVRIMSFNASLENTNNLAIAEEIGRQDPDIAVIVEIGREKRPLMEALKARYPYQEDCIHLDFCYLAILSKFPIVDFESHSKWRGPPVVRATFGPELGGLTVIGTHLIRFPHQRSQLIQMSELGSFASKFMGPRIVAGDFNATPFSRLLATFENAGKLRRLTWWTPSWPARFALAQLAIDHIYASDQVQVLREPRIGGNAGSDHYPVIVDIGVPTKLAAQASTLVTGE